MQRFYCKLCTIHHTNWQAFFSVWLCFVAFYSKHATAMYKSASHEPTKSRNKSTVWNGCTKSFKIKNNNKNIVLNETHSSDSISPSIHWMKDYQFQEMGIIAKKWMYIILIWIWNQITFAIYLVCTTSVMCLQYVMCFHMMRKQQYYFYAISLF